MNDFLLEYKFLIFAVLGICVFILSIYLGVLWSKLKVQKKEQLAYQQKFEAELKKQDEYFKDSLISIARATLQGQCDLSEACIRIHKLLKYYPDVQSDTEFDVIKNMYEEIKDFDTHDDRLNLSKQEIFKQDNARFRIEAKYKHDMLKSLELLKKRIESLI